jgi:hypothetical protein
LTAGAEPTGLKRIMIFSDGKAPAEASAAVASLGRFMRTVDAVMVRGRSGEGGLSMMGDAAAGELSDAMAEEYFPGFGDEAFEATATDLLYVVDVIIFRGVECSLRVLYQGESKEIYVTA